MNSGASLRADVALVRGDTTVEASFDTAQGTLVLIGPNGAGKTSLLLSLLGVISLRRGKIEVGDSVLLDTVANIFVPTEQRRLAYVPQNYALFPHLTVRENVMFALESSPQALTRALRVERVEQVLTELGVVDLAERRARTLSGGEQQRVALARALSVEPCALLLDEPLAALDVHARVEVRGFLLEALNRLRLPTLLVTHDAADAYALGHQIVAMESGKITQRGTWDQLREDPATEFVRRFVQSLHETPSLHNS